MVAVAGTHLEPRHVLELTVLLRRNGHVDTAERLEAALATNQSDVAVAGRDRGALLDVLEEPLGEPLATLRRALRDE
jgi:hypothetical protein